MAARDDLAKQNEQLASHSATLDETNILHAPLSSTISIGLPAIISFDSSRKLECETSIRHLK
jgi:hypothetical protein